MPVVHIDRTQVFWKERFKRLVGNWALAGFVELFTPDDYIVLQRVQAP